MILMLCMFIIIIIIILIIIIRVFCPRAGPLLEAQEPRRPPMGGSPGDVSVEPVT